MLWRDPPASELLAARPFGSARVTRAGAVLELEVPGLRDGLLLPPLELGSKSEVLLRLEADCAQPTEVAVYVSPAGA